MFRALAVLVVGLGGLVLLGLTCLLLRLFIVLNVFSGWFELYGLLLACLICGVWFVFVYCVFKVVILLIAFADC